MAPTNSKSFENTIDAFGTLICSPFDPRSSPAMIRDTLCRQAAGEGTAVPLALAPGKPSGEEPQAVEAKETGSEERRNGRLKAFVNRNDGGVEAGHHRQDDENNTDQLPVVVNKSI
jgi:hypothetical protein